MKSLTWFQIVAYSIASFLALMAAALAFDLDAQRQVVKLDAVLRRHDAHRSADGGQLGSSDLHRRLVRVVQVQPSPKEAPLVLPVDNLER